MSIERYKGQPLPLSVKFPSNPFTVYGKDYIDITEVSMNLKQNLATDLDDAFLQKTQSGLGVTVDSVNHRFVMALEQSDYTNLIAGQHYFLTVNVQLTGYSEMIELKITEDNRLVSIVNDTNRA